MTLERPGRHPVAPLRPRPHAPERVPRSHWIGCPSAPEYALALIDDVDNVLRFVQLLSATRIEEHLVHHIESFLAERSHAYHQRRSDFDALISSATHNHDSLALFRDMAFEICGPPGVPSLRAP